VFLCISSYSKTLSKRIIYALFSQPVVGFWGLRPQTSTGAASLNCMTLLGEFRNLPTFGKNPEDAYGWLPTVQSGTK